MADARWQYPDGYEISRFDAQEVIDARAVTDLWAAETPLAFDERERRVHEVHLVARGPEGDLAGVTTAYLARHQQLHMPLWHYRAFVPSAHRRTAVAVYLAVRGREDLSRRFADGTDPRAGGMIYEVENPGLKRTLDAALWEPALFTYIGANAQDDHVRVHYFPGALAPEPQR